MPRKGQDSDDTTATAAQNDDFDTINDNVDEECATCNKTCRYRLCKCEFCEKTFCRSCQNIDPKVANLLPKFDTVHWYCTECNAKVTNILANNKTSDHKGAITILTDLSKGITEKFDALSSTKISVESDIKDMNDKISNLEVRFNEKIALLSDTITEKLKTELPQQLSENLVNLENTMNSKIETCNNDLGGRIDKCLGAIPTEFNRTWSSLFSGNEKKKTESSVKPPTNFRALLQDEMQKQKQEEIDRDQRTNNIVIYRITESQKSVPEERKNDDLTFFKSLCSAIGVGEKKVKNIIRLGPKKNENVPRPVKVMLENIDDKSEIMKNLAKLKNAEERFKKVSVSHDLTDDQMKVLKERIEYAGELTKNDESGEFLFRVRGPPWNLRIVKVKRSTIQQNEKGKEETTASQQ